jgi:hypothetical protein
MTVVTVVTVGGLLGAHGCEGHRAVGCWAAMQRLYGVGCTECTRCEREDRTTAEIRRAEAAPASSM